MLPNENAAVELSFYKKRASKFEPLMQQEIRQAYRKVKAMPYGQKYGSRKFNPDTVASLDNLRVSEATVAKLLYKRLSDDVKSLRKKSKSI